MPPVFWNIGGLGELCYNYVCYARDLLLQRLATRQSKIIIFKTHASLYPIRRQSLCVRRQSLLPCCRIVGSVTPGLRYQPLRANYISVFSAAEHMNLNVLLLTPTSALDIHAQVMNR